jgi:hypothetical protein
MLIYVMLCYVKFRILVFQLLDLKAGPENDIYVSKHVLHSKSTCCVDRNVVYVICSYLHNIRMREKRNTCRIFVGKPEVKRLLGTPRRR